MSGFEHDAAFSNVPASLMLCASRLQPAGHDELELFPSMAVGLLLKAGGPPPPLRNNHE
jgi:hypothetical protein